MSPRRRGNRSPTLLDIAEHVGVSQATVSAILSDGPNANAFAETTRVSVRAAADKLGYKVNPLARALRRARSGVIGCISCNQHDLYYARTVEVAELYARDCGYGIAAASMGYDFKRFDYCISLMTAWRVEGLLLFVGGRSLPQDALDQLGELGIPIQVGDGDADADASASSIARFIAQSGWLAADHLVALGHSSIGVIGSNPNNLHSSERLKGIGERLLEAGLDLPDSHCFRTPAELHGPHAGYACTLAVLDSGATFTALACLNDLTAMGALTALRERGVAVPGDCSVIGFDDLALDAEASEQNRLGNFLNPPLTTVRLPTRELCQDAMRRLLSRIEHPDVDVPREVDLRPRLILRSSTDRPGRRAG